MAAIKFSDLENAYVFVCFGAVADHQAYVCRDNGRIYQIFGDDDEEFEEDDVPDDLGDPERYIAVPNQHDLDLGRDLVMEFMGQHMPDDYDLVAGFFRKRGAYGRFKDFLDSKEQLDAWHEYENEAVRQALREWCAVNGLVIIEEQP